MANSDIEVINAQYEGLKKQINDIAKTMDLRFEQWNEDRKSITDLEVRLKTVEAKLDGARDDITDGNKKVINRLDEHLEPVPQMISDTVKKELGKKGMIDKIKEAVNG
jgi:hemerythrin-like domain-containing protein